MSKSAWLQGDGSSPFQYAPIHAVQASSQHVRYDDQLPQEPRIAGCPSVQVYSHTHAL